MRASPFVFPLAVLLGGLLAWRSAPADDRAPAEPLATPGAVARLAVPGHAMQYLIALPQGWTPQRTWPVVLVEESAEKNFRSAMQRYVDARGALPFILVMPYSVILGAQGQRDPAVYPYSAATWDSIGKQGACAFELEGVNRMLDMVRGTYHGEPKVYVTGLEAGAHLVWALTLRQPETLAAAAPVAGNFRHRCVDDADLSTHPARATLPVQAFIGAEDTPWRGGALHAQFAEARQLAQAHGFQAIGETVVPGRGHEALAGEVLRYFAGLRGSSGQSQ
ncbi:hypothetical protein E4L96_22355 [Massilia arenosa]|uniref:Alpha/beta hydrolase n=1 Tax=Zemynaea arenosa TaxID=2561931 RepID=A0A4Y9RTA8_9BURK|nr:hypothetical protein [Massilia arenosa]TFW10769.1 hypothetical protein E4L96_22355 [Massilia arenosa]